MMLKGVLKRLFQGHNKLSIFVVLLGAITWSLTMVKSGLIYDFGMGFWGPNGHDGIWHIAVAESLARGTLNMPIFAGEAIRNYHIGFDLLLAIFHRITFIPLVNLYFQVFPVILSLGVGLSTYSFVLNWKKSKSKALWATFFVYFGGSFGWLTNLVRSQTFGGESMFWSQQSISTLINPPFALSLLMIFVGLKYFQHGIKENQQKSLTISTILFGFLVFVKVYAGILILAGLAIAGIWNIFKKRSFKTFRVFGSSLVLSLLLFLPLNSGSGQSLLFQPFWFLETLMLISDRVGWEKLGSAMINWRMAGTWHKAFAGYTLAFFIFWYGNIGTRLVGQFYISKKFKNRKIDTLEIIIFSIISFGTILPMLFIQKGTAWNTIQFFYYSLVFLGVLTGAVIGDWLNKIKRYKQSNMYDISLYHTKRLLLIGSVVIFTIPTTVSTLWMHYLPKRPPAKISNEELEALKFLKDQPDGVVLTLPFDVRAAISAINNPPRPLFLYESTAYVSALSGKTVYLEDEVNLEITGYEWRERRKEIEEILKLNNPTILSQFLQSKGIDYLYITSPNKYFTSINNLKMEKIFNNETVTVNKVN